jgi:hypothetical protein
VRWDHGEGVVEALVEVVVLFCHQYGQGQPLELAVLGVTCGSAQDVAQPFREELVGPHAPIRPVDDRRRRAIAFGPAPAVLIRDALGAVLVAGRRQLVFVAAAAPIAAPLVTGDFPSADHALGAVLVAGRRRQLVFVVAAAPIAAPLVTGAFPSADHALGAVLVVGRRRQLVFVGAAAPIAAPLVTGAFPPADPGQEGIPPVSLWHLALFLYVRGGVFYAAPPAAPFRTFPRGSGRRNGCCCCSCCVIGVDMVDVVVAAVVEATPPAAPSRERGVRGSVGNSRCRRVLGGSVDALGPGKLVGSGNSRCPRVLGGLVDAFGLGRLVGSGH